MRYPCYHRFSDLYSRPAEWLWRGWLPLGELAILDGDPGVGKSLLTLDLCARLTAGRPWPDGVAAGPPCNVVVLNAEDNVATTVRPRLQALGADLDRAYFLEGIVAKHGDEPLRLPADAVALRDVVCQTQAKLVVVDPLVGFLDRSVVTHNDQSVRAALGVLAALAHEQQCAVLLVRHLTKKPQQRAVYRGGGSIGFVAAVRCGWLLAADPEQPGRRVLAQVKNNLDELPSSLSFEIRSTEAGSPELAWVGTSGQTCDQLLECKRGRGRPALRRERAEANLKLFLEEAPRTVDDVREFAEEQKISERTLERVKKDLAIRSVRAPYGDGRATMWLLPGQLPPGVSEEMLTPLETHEDEIAAAQEDIDASMAEIVRKYCGAKGEGGAGPQREAAVVAPVVAQTEAAGEPRVSKPAVVIPDEPGTIGGSAELAVAGPVAPVVVVPDKVRPTPPPEPVSPSRAAPPFVLAPLAVPTKTDAERIAKEERERKRVRRWP